MNLDATLKTEYRDLWKSCAVRPSRLAEVDALVDRIVAHKQRYSAAGKPHGVPWHVVGIIHMLEGSGNFATHLHNGEPLTARTVQVPKGRPLHGPPPPPPPPPPTEGAQPTPPPPPPRRLPPPQKGIGRSPGRCSRSSAS